MDVHVPFVSMSHGPCPSKVLWPQAGYLKDVAQKYNRWMVDGFEKFLYNVNKNCENEYTGPDKPRMHE